MPVRQLFAGSQQRLQALCIDCHSEKTPRESAQPTSIKSRLTPRAMQHYAGSPKLPLLVFDGQAWAPFPLPILRLPKVSLAEHIALGIYAHSHVARARSEWRWTAWTRPGPRPRSCR